MPINMSHCRFHNTLEALQECRDTLDEPGHEYSSNEEREAACRLFVLCAKLAVQEVGKYTLGGGTT